LLYYMIWMRIKSTSPFYICIWHTWQLTAGQEYWSKEQTWRWWLLTTQIKENTSPKNAPTACARHNFPIYSFNVSSQISNTLSLIQLGSSHHSIFFLANLHHHSAFLFRESLPCLFCYFFCVDLLTKSV